MSGHIRDGLFCALSIVFLMLGDAAAMDNPLSLSEHKINCQWFQNELDGRSQNGQSRTQVIALQVSVAQEKKKAKSVECLLIPVPSKPHTKVQILDSGGSKLRYLDDLSSVIQKNKTTGRKPCTPITVSPTDAGADTWNRGSIKLLKDIIAKHKLELSQSQEEAIISDYPDWSFLLMFLEPDSKGNFASCPIMIAFTPRFPNSYYIPICSLRRPVLSLIDLDMTYVFPSKDAGKGLKVKYSDKSIPLPVRKFLPDLVQGRYLFAYGKNSDLIAGPSTRENPDCVLPPTQYKIGELNAVFSKGHLAVTADSLPVLGEVIRHRTDDIETSIIKFKIQLPGGREY